MRPAINERLSLLLAEVEAPEPLHELASAVLAKAMDTYQAHPAWPIPELPRRCLLALGAPEPLADAAATAAVLFYGASDVIDDAQDGELEANPYWPGAGWEQAVNTGNLLLFMSQQVLLEAPASAEVRARWARAFATAGVRLSRGQSRDLEARGCPDWDEATILGITRDKAGAAWGCLASLAPIWAGEPEARVAAWYAFGEALGMAHQLASDVWPYLLPGPHADRERGQLTLPLLHARGIDPAVARLWDVTERLGPEAQEALRERVAASGAVLYARMRVEVWKKEAQARLAALECPSLSEAVAPLLAMVTFERATGPGA